MLHERSQRKQSYRKSDLIRNPYRYEIRVEIVSFNIVSSTVLTRTSDLNFKLKQLIIHELFLMQHWNILKFHPFVQLFNMLNMDISFIITINVSVYVTLYF